MAKYLNHFETIQEISMRLRDSFVLYYGEPYYVLAVCNHRDDGVFRVYMEPAGRGYDNMVMQQRKRPPVHDYVETNPERGKAVDTWMKDNPDSPIIRRKADSPHFNKFRPFPLGMCNVDGRVAYMERNPNRRSEQGLTVGMIGSSFITLGTSVRANRGALDFFSKSFYDCIKANHPSASDSLEALRDPEILNEAVAFHRHFAFVRGPLGMVFLAYKTDVVGVMPYGDLSCVQIGRAFSHVKEVVEDLNLFGFVTVQQ